MVSSGSKNFSNRVLLTIEEEIVSQGLGDGEMDEQVSMQGVR